MATPQIIPIFVKNAGLLRATVIDAGSVELSEIERRLGMSFLGAQEFFWLGDLSKLSVAVQKPLLAFLADYEGPHQVGFFINEKKSDNQILLEPSRRNTAPCIAYANYKILKINPNANIVTAPSDHLILRENEFVSVISQGLDFIANKDALLTLGIKPSRPETGYGYIQFDQKQKEKKNANIFKVKTFTEKPNKELAQVFLDSGEFFWNSGIFIWSLKSIMKSFSTNLPEVSNLFKEGFNLYNTPEEEAFIAKAYFECRNVSIDYGIMEKADNVFVYCSNFGWADLGTWGSLNEHLAHDKNKNSIRGNNVFAYDLHNCIINMPDDKLAVVQGLKDYIIVEFYKIF